MAKLLHTLIKTNNIHNSSIRSDEGLTLEMSALLIFHGGNSTFINTLDKTKFLFHSLSCAAPQILYKLEFCLTIFNVSWFLAGGGKGKGSENRNEEFGRAFSASSKKISRILSSFSLIYLFLHSRVKYIHR